MKPTARLGRAIGAATLTLPLHACQGWQSALDPQGPEARHLADLFWTFTAAVTAVWVLTMLALVFALRRRRPAGADPLAKNPVAERRMTALACTSTSPTR